MYIVHAEGKGIESIVVKQIKAVVLAAGKGTRLRTEDNDAPKVMRTVNGKPLLRYVLKALSFIEKSDTIIVVGYKKESIINDFPGYTYVVQSEQLGTGHAVLAAKEKLMEFTGALLVCYGDMPAIKQDVYEQLIKTHFSEGNDCTLLTGVSDTSMGFGRILRDENGSFLHVAEEKDCTRQQLEIKELNTGVYVFDTPYLLRALAELKNNNSQGEYYITDVPAIMKGQGAKIGIYKENLGDDIIGVNTLEQLNMAEGILRGEGVANG